MENIYNISVRSNLGEDFYLLLGDFLDAYYRTSSDNRKDMLMKPPVDMEYPEYVPFLAATAHKLALEYDISPPEWVFSPRCFLSGNEPFFACHAKGNLRLLFMYKSPPEFKHRNLFVDENVLTRV